MKENRCDRESVMFHGYTIRRCGTVIGKMGKPLKTELRERRGGRHDVCVRLFYNDKPKKWTLQRLVAACFIGPIEGYQINHKDRDTLNNNVENLERVTASQNQRHWRLDVATERNIRT